MGGGGGAETTGKPTWLPFTEKAHKERLKQDRTLEPFWDPPWVLRLLCGVWVCMSGGKREVGEGREMKFPEVRKHPPPCNVTHVLAIGTNKHFILKPIGYYLGRSSLHCRWLNVFTLNTTLVLSAKSSNVWRYESIKLLIHVEIVSWQRPRIFIGMQKYPLIPQINLPEFSWGFLEL